MRLSKPLVICSLILLGVSAYAWSLRSADVVNAPPRPGPIVALGDSLTAGFGGSPGRSYPDQLSAIIGRPVLNRGVSRETVADAARRLEPDVFAVDPSIVIVLLGGNDLLQQKDLDASFVQLETLVRRIQADGALVVLVGLKGLSPVGGVAKRYSRLAQATGCVFVPNILKGILGDKALSSDRIHPNDEGYGIVAGRIAEALEPWLGRGG